MIGLLKAIKTLVSCHRPKTLYERRLGPCSPEPTSCRSLGTLAPKLQEFKVGRIGQKAWIGLKGPPWHRHLGLLDLIRSSGLPHRILLGRHAFTVILRQ